MRASEFITETDLVHEVSMKPSMLRQMASEIDATAGMEFELIVPDLMATDEDEEIEPDFDSDERVLDFDSIAEFFVGDWNSRRDVRAFISTLQEDYSDWLTRRLDDRWADEGREFFDEYAEDWFDMDQAVEDATEEIENEYGDDLNSDDKERMIAELVQEKKQEWLDDEWNEQGRPYDRAWNTWYEENSDGDGNDVYDFFQDRGYSYMSDLPYGDNDLSWPYYTTTSSGSTSIANYAESFGEAIGRPVNWSDRYHGATRSPGKYVVEPDSSLEPNSGDRDAGGLEFVSPPLPIGQMLTDLQKVVEWARENGCYTNESTGLHINVSVLNMHDLDYVKLALLLGDVHVLQEFERMGNTYASSAMKEIQSRAKQNQAQVPEMLDAMRRGLNKIAAQSVHNGATNKYISINNKGDYIEFRSPGGDWMSGDINKVINTLYRFVVALDAATDAEKYKEEYSKKLYKLIVPRGTGSQEQFAGMYFAQYAAGMIDKATLMANIQQAAKKRGLSKIVPDGVTKYEWEITHPRWGTYNLIATSGEEALANLKKYERQTEHSPDNTFTIKLVNTVGNQVPAPRAAQAAQPASQGTGERWQRWNILMNNQQVFAVSARNQGEANAQARQWLSQRSPEFMRDHQGEEVSVVPDSR